MCGQFELPIQGLTALCEEIDRKYAAFSPALSWRRSGTAHPGDILPVLARGKNGKTGAFLMRWGYRMQEKGALLINARSETANHKPLFADSYALRRCLIPAQSYDEWQRTGREKQKFTLTPAGIPSFYLAGLYRYEEDRRLPAFVVLTRAAAADIAFIHHRMPVLFSASEGEKWLSGTEAPDAVIARALTVLDAAGHCSPDVPPEWAEA